MNNMGFSGRIRGSLVIIPAITFIFIFSENFFTILHNTNLYIQIINKSSNVKNVTMKECKLVVYNRVPKCGSTTLLYIINWLKKFNNFTTFHSLLYDKQHLKKTSQLNLLLNLRIQLPGDPCSVYDRHLYFINFENLGFERPIYINMVRHPIDREISNFHYLRSQKHLNTLKGTFKDLPPSAFMKLTIEEAVLKKALPDYNMSDGDLSVRDGLIPYFCGHDIFCRRHNYLPALQVAKSNIESYFSVVGILEDLSTTLYVFQLYLPRIFGNITSYVTTNLVTNNNDHEDASDEVRKELESYLKLEIDLYTFIKQRLIRQKEAMPKISDNTEGAKINMSHKNYVTSYITTQF